MSKIKMSFSLIIALLLVGIMSTAAFAKGAYLESLSPDKAGGFVFSFTNQQDTNDQFYVKVYYGDKFQNVMNWSSPEVVNAGAKKTINFTYDATSWNFQVGTIYKFALVKGNLQSGQEVGYKYGAYTNPADTTQASIANNPDNIKIDVNGSGLVNSNHTGQDVGSRTPRQSTHGSYQNNTNSCASCHQTHTAANGDYLLFKDGVYSTCSACHDGTTGAYNAFAPATKDMTEEIAGTFDVSTANHNGSLHQADGSLKIASAPGGNVGATTGAYSQDFDCASCHAPHGGGSAGENNLNTDPMGWGAVPYASKAGVSMTFWQGHGYVTKASTDENKLGHLFFNEQIYTSADAAKTAETANGNTPTPFVLVRTTVTQDNVVLNPANKAAYDFFWNRANVPAGTQVIQTYRWNGKSYIKDYSLWNRDLGYPGTANTVLKTGGKGGTDLTQNTPDNINFVWRDGFAYGDGVASVDYADISIGIDVETTNSIEDLWNGNVPDSGIEMSKYCSACHMDYASETRTNVTGTFTQAHRHATIGRDETTCVRCHYAHGSEAKIMKDANDNTYWDLKDKLGSDNALSYLTDPNPNSAIKRYTGMSVCYACHGSGEQFLGSPANAKKDKTTGEFLKGGQPGDLQDRSILNK